MPASDGEKLGRTNNGPRGKGTNHSKATLTDLTLEALVNRTPAVWVGKTMLDPTVDPDVSIDARNPVAKRENKKSMHYRRDTVSTLKQHPMT